MTKKLEKREQLEEAVSTNQALLSHDLKVLGRRLRSEVSQVKDAVSDSLSPIEQTRRHPLASVLVAGVAGALTGHWIFSAVKAHPKPTATPKNPVGKIGKELLYQGLIALARGGVSRIVKI